MVNDTRTPVHFWMVSILALLVFVGGVYGYVRTAYDADQYLSVLTADQRAWVDGRPAWLTSAWGISVLAGLFAALAMLLRQRAAGGLFLVSWLAFVPSVAWAFFLATPGAFQLLGIMGVVAALVILIFVTALIVYCANMARRGVLR